MMMMILLYFRGDDRLQPGNDRYSSWSPSRDYFAMDDGGGGVGLLVIVLRK